MRDDAWAFWCLVTRIRHSVGTLDTHLSRSFASSHPGAARRRNGVGWTVTLHYLICLGRGLFARGTAPGGGGVTSRAACPTATPLPKAQCRGLVARRAPTRALRQTLDGSHPHRTPKGDPKLRCLADRPPQYHSMRAHFSPVCLSREYRFPSLRRADTRKSILFHHSTQVSPAAPTSASAKGGEEGEHFGKDREDRTD